MLLWLSVTLIVKFEVPVAVGVPERMPLVLPSESPLGSEPELTAKLLYVPLPPVALIVAL